MEASPALISNVTEAVRGEARAWQSRPPDALCPIVYWDARMVKRRDNGRARNRAVYVALGVTKAGQKEVPGLWSSANEGAKFWLQVLTEWKKRGLQDIFLACVDGLQGFPRAIEAVYPQTSVQLCLVPLVRGSLQDVSGKERRAVAPDGRAIYQSATTEQAGQQRETFAARWDAQSPPVSALWRRHGEQITPWFAFPPEIRKIIHTANAGKSLRMPLRKIIKTRGSFPNEEAALKLLYLALRHVSKKGGGRGPPPNWKQALNRFAVLWETRFPRKAF